MCKRGPLTSRLRLALLTVTAALSCAAPSIAANGAATSGAWSDAALLYFSSLASMSPPAPALVLASPATVARYVWYGSADQCTLDPTGWLVCDGSYSSLSQAQLRMRMHLPRQMGQPLWVRARISIAADDYFALYVNGQLQTPLGVWHDDTGDHATTFDIAGALQLGAENVIDVFACDGYKPGNGAAPGPTPAQGWDGCPVPQMRVNHWLLIDGLVQVLTKDESAPPVFSRGLATGATKPMTGGWRARSGPTQ